MWAALTEGVKNVLGPALALDPPATTPPGEVRLLLSPVMTGREPAFDWAPLLLLPHPLTQEHVPDDVLAAIARHNSLAAIVTACAEQCMRWVTQSIVGIGACRGGIAQRIVCRWGMFFLFFSFFFFFFFFFSRSLSGVLLDC
jgi:hypothetical protein